MRFSLMIVMSVVSAAAFHSTGCSGGVDAGISSDGGSSTGQIGSPGEGSIGLLTAPWLVLDLASGVPEPRAEMTTFSDPDFRDRKLVLRRITGNGTDYFLGIFELTQAQWTRLAGTAPWSTVPSAVVGTSAIAGDRPAFALSADSVNAALAAWNVRGKIKLGVPSGAQWSFACAADATAPYCWGSVTDRSTLAQWAVTWEVLDGTPGPRAVGGRKANPLGLSDLHGNVWEWVDGCTALRGGSWHDSVSAGARQVSFNLDAADLRSDTAHALVGVRLLARP